MPLSSPTAAEEPQEGPTDPSGLEASAAVADSHADGRGLSLDSENLRTANLNTANSHTANSYAENLRTADSHTAKLHTENSGSADSQTAPDAATHLRTLEAVITDGLMTFRSVRDQVGTITDFEWLYVNPAAERIVGRDRVGLLGKHLLQEMPGNRETGLFDAYVQVVESGETWHDEFAYAFEGLNHWFSSTATRVGDGFAVKFTDITESKQADAALRDSEKRFHQLADSVPQIVWMADPAGKFTYLNQRWFDYTGVGFEAVQEGGVTALHPDESNAVWAAWHNLFKHGEGFEYELRLRRADGVYRWQLARAAPQRDASGRVLNWFGTFTDIEERKRYEVRLRFQAEAGAALASGLEYRANLQKVAELAVLNIADGCLVERVSEEPRREPDREPAFELVAVAHAEPAKVELVRTLRRRFPPKSTGPGGVAEVVRTGRPLVYENVTEDLLSRVAADEAHLDLLRRVGFRSMIMVPLKLRERVTGVLTLAWSARPCEPDDLALAEELAQRASVALDNARSYAEARAAEADLREFTKTLERRVAERTAELEEALRELDQFAYIASHDLKAPLRAMDNLAAWIAEDAGELLPDKSRAHLDKLRGRAARMEKLLSDLLTYSRADRLSRVVQTVDVAHLVADVTELLAPPPGFEVEVRSDVKHIVTSVVPLETVLRNLIGNAFKHHHKSEGRVWVTLRDTDEAFLFEVGDDGPGIEQTFHERIFQIFQTLQPRDAVEASGIGLAVVKKIVEGRGGEVGIAPTPAATPAATPDPTPAPTAAAGATFWFVWPKEAAA